MLVLIPRLVKNFGKKITRFSKKHSKKMSSFLVASRLVSVGLLFLFIPLGISFDSNGYKYTNNTTVKLDTNSPFLLTEPVKTVEISSGRSRAEMTELGLSHDPAEIKMLIQEIAPKYDLDWRLVYAIGYLESANYNSQLARNQNNFFGRKASSGSYASWPNTLVAIENQCEYLKTRYIDRGMVTPYQMNRVYAEGDTWGGKVTTIMGSL